MYHRDLRDMLAGGLMIAFGSAVCAHAFYSYPIGTLRHIGPGMFPMWLGGTLAIVGFGILLPAFRRRGVALPHPAYRPLIAVICGVILFIFILEAAGLVPAVVVLTLSAVLADSKLGWAGACLLAVFMSLLTTTIFKYGLSVPVDVARLPFQ